MATTLAPWVPTADEVRCIVAELRPVIDECVRRSRALRNASADGPDAWGRLAS